MLPVLVERLLAIHAALAEARIKHAFGGAIALAYYTHEPRGTRDIDVNIFIDSGRPEPALAALPAAIEQPDGTLETITRDGQIRLWWDDTPVDVFFDMLPIHAQAARRTQRGVLGGIEIPIVGPVELLAFKAMFARTKDWADIEAVFAAQAASVDDVAKTVAALVGEDDDRIARLREAHRQAASSRRAQ